MDIKFMNDVNIKSLPTYVREAFEQVLNKYEMHVKYYTHASLNEAYITDEYPIHKEFFNKLSKLFQNEELFVDDFTRLSPDSSNNFEEYYEFVGKCSKNSRDYYRFRDKEKFSTVIYSSYTFGLYTGFYSEPFEDAVSQAYFDDSRNEFLKNKIFNLAYINNDCLSLNLSVTMNESYERNVINTFNLHMYAQKVGQFMRAWEIITQYPDWFEPLFKSRFSKQVKPTLDSEVINFFHISDSSDADMIRSLHLMGILDLVKELFPPNTKTNRVAGAVSSITGLKLGTSQSYVNPIYSSESTLSQTNNPLANKDKVEVVRQKLISLGINPQKLKKNKF